MATKTKRKSRPTANAKHHHKRSAPYASVALTVCVGLWLLWAASLISYNPADPPGHSVAPINDSPQNWVGHVGAVVAHKTYLMLGPGIWVFLTGLIVILTRVALGRRPTQPILRLTGLVIMSLCASALFGWTTPPAATSAPDSLTMSLWHRPEGHGGLIALFLNDQLASRFGAPGTIIIFVVGLWVGAILAIDQLITAAARSSAVAVLALARIVPGATARLAAWRSDRRAAAAEVTVIKRSPAKVGRRRGTAAAVDEPIDEDAGGLGAVEAFDPDEEGLEDGVDAPAALIAAKKAFDPDALREKIRQLPINFAPRAVPQPETTSQAEVDLSGYQFPSLDILEAPESNFSEEIEKLVRDQAVDLESALQQYRIEGEVVGIDSGPVITLFEVRLAPGTKVSQISSIASDLARALRAHNIRVVPNMAGKDTVGIEVPNLKKERVRIKELMTNNPEKAKNMRLPMFLGKNASGNPLIADLATMPHMLIAGTTGSGKSVCMNSIIISFLYTKRPDELKLVLVDPKMVEMSMFRDVPHLMCPVITEMAKAAAILEWATTKMDERYEILAEAGVRDIAGYNALSWEDLKERFEPTNEAEEARIPKKLPYLVFVIDELADLMMTNKEVEGFIVRLAQKSRAVGMHLILATQRPQANVVTGLIKSNMPCRVSFKVASAMDSRIVLDQKGAELLLGQGDMLYLSPRTSKLTRAQGTLVDDIEIRRAVKFLKGVAAQSFEPQLMQIKNGGVIEQDGERDPLFDDAVEVVLQTRRGSVSLLQRRLTIGYSRASRLIEEMAGAGIIGAYKGSQAREVNISPEEWEALKEQAAKDAALADDANPNADDQATEEDEDLDDDSVNAPAIHTASQATNPVVS